MSDRERIEGAALYCQAKCDECIARIAVERKQIDHNQKSDESHP